MENQLECVQFLGKLSAALFAGSAVYGSLVHHPAILENINDLDAVEQFVFMFKRAKPSQVVYILTAVTCNSFVYYMKGNKNCMYSAALLLSVPAYTMITMKPTNNALNEIPEKFMRSDRSPEAKESILKGARSLLNKWGKLHAVRSIIGVAAVSLLIYKS